ncbi:MAG TPA: dTDP-4-dehydrorhamnose reductase [Egibacteraceae bacterium]|nr:dTDP-4-dehydrorhamnose reductase [Actinomycetota bacterium]HWB72466.1 dTDP-4-dehydrorhamnose reductase [Egibacteraceae bacterium]
MKVLVTGAGGQLGRDLLVAFADTDCVGLGNGDLDVSDEPAVVAAVRDHAPDLVVHAAAYTKVDACESDPDTAWRVNAAGAWWVARACVLGDAAMVYLSTDYVFDGLAERAYTEFDPPNPQSVYGRSKEAGEQLVRQTLARHYVVRTSWLHGPHGGNFVKTMLRLARERGQVSVVDDQTGSPTFTFDLAPAIRRLAVSGRYGTYHLTNQGHCTWFELARAAFEQAGVEVDLRATDSASFAAPAPRPAFSVLDNRMARMLGLEPLPHWESSLTRLLAELGEP